MLAQLFLDARKLGITQKERDALIDLLMMFEQGYFVHCDAVNAPPDDDYRVGLAFNMGVFDCGTAACIAGWCDVLFKTDFVFAAEDVTHRPGRRRRLQDLFYGCDGGKEQMGLGEITPGQAAVALRNYLTTGKPEWVSVRRINEPFPVSKAAFK